MEALWCWYASDDPTAARPSQRLSVWLRRVARGHAGDERTLIATEEILWPEEF